MDRVGASLDDTLADIRTRLSAPLLLLQTPVYADSGRGLTALVDLVTMERLEFAGDEGQDVQRTALVK